MMTRAEWTAPNERTAGVALLTVIVFVAMTGMFIAALSTRLMIDKRQVDAFVARALALHAAEYAAQSAIDTFAHGGSTAIGLDREKIKLASDGPAGTSLPSFESPGVVPVETADLRGAKFYAAVIAWANDGRDNDGNGQADGPEEHGITCVYGVARAGQSVRAVEIAYRVDTAQNMPARRLSWREIPPPAKGN